MERLEICLIIVISLSKSLGYFFDCIDAASFHPLEINYPFTVDMLDFYVSDIIKAIEDIKPNAAPGPDEIPIMLLRNCNEAVDLEKVFFC